MCRKLIIPACLILALSVINHAKANLVGWWNFDEMSGVVAHDSSGYGNDGTFVGTPEWTVGKVNGAIECDGGDYVEVPGAADINPESITLMTWVNFNDVDPAAMQRQDYLSRGDDYAFSLHEWGARDGTAAEGKISGIVTSAGGWSVVSGNTVVEADTWYHTALTYDTDTQMLTLYLDGVVDGELSIPAGLEHRLGGPLTIGTYNGRDLLGRIDEVKIFDTALTQDEIWAIALGEKNPFASNPDPADGARVVDPNVTLSWSAGFGAKLHIVYFGDNFDVVYNATLGIPQALTTYDPGPLELNTTYYWRVDEFDGINTHKGDVWNFTVTDSDFFYNEIGAPIPVTIALDRLGAVVAEGVTIDDVEAFIASLDLQLLEIMEPGGLVIIGLEGPLDRQSLVELARDIESIPDVPFTRVGLVLNSVPYQDPFILTDEFITQFKAGVTREQIEVFNSNNAVRIVMENPFVKNQFLLTVSEDSQSDALAMANLYYESDLTELAYPNFIGVYYDTQIIPNDTLFANQWHLDNTGQGGGTIDADADLPEAWDITMGDPDIIIAVIENGGFDMSHPDLTPNRWVNPGEDLNNDGTIQPAEIDGVDDDGNTYDDDFYGWDFTGCTATSGPGCGDNDPSPAAGEDHGTAVAGVAGARGDNNLGVCGSCPDCSLMFLRTGYNGSDWAKSLAFDYARQRGAQIITNSWVAFVPTPHTITAINNATAAGVVVLFAAGNTSANVCSGASQDPRASLPDVIAVSSSSNQNRKVVFAANGNCIDILAPSHRGYDPTDPYTGTLNITTTDRTGTAGYNNTNPVANCPSTEPSPPPPNARDYTFCFGGTSSATPLTAGAVGLILSVNPTLTRLQVQRLLQDTADKIEDSAGDYDDNNGFSSPATGVATHSWGRLNAFEAVRIAAPISVSPDVVGGKGGVDIFLRDNRLDWGNTEQPSNVLFEPTPGFIGHWRSMDIKVDAPPLQPVAPTAATFDAFVDETPSAIPGQTNKVYVRVRNRGPVTATSVTVKLHWTQFGTALPALPSDFWTAFPANSSVLPVQWHPLNCSGSVSSTCTISNLAYSGSSVAGTATDAAQIVEFDFPAPTVAPGMPNHFCLLAMVDSPQDRILPKSRPAPIPADFVVDTLTPTDNNVTHRNYSNLPTSDSDTFDESFFVRNPYSESITAVLTLDAPDGWEVQLDNLFFDDPFVLSPGEEILVKMYIYAPSINATGDVTITQSRIDTEIPLVMGGVTYRFGTAFAYPDSPFARRPDPPDGAVLSGTWATLNWLPGTNAVSHDVYFGDNFSDVYNGTGGTFRGNLELNTTFLIVGFPGYPYPDGLVPGTTYYWRIDEVNDANPNSPWRGDVWSFTIAPELDVENLLDNGGFEDGVVNPWTTYGDASMEVVQEDPVEGDYCLHVTVNSAGANFWDAGLQHSGHVFEAGKSYTLSAYVKTSEGTMDINFKPERSEDPWEGYGDQIFTMTEEWAAFTVNTGEIPETVEPASITFHIAFTAGEFFIDDVRFYKD